MKRFFPGWVPRAITRVHLGLILAVLVPIILGGAPIRVSADPLVVQSGYFATSGGDPAAFRFVGDGFVFGAILFQGGEDFGPVRACSRSSPCNVGDPIEFSSSFNGVGFPAAPIVFDGEELAGTAEYPNFVFVGGFQVNGPTVLAPPIGPDDVARLNGPFTMAGSLAIHAAQGTYAGYVLGPQLFRVDLLGSGTAGLILGPPACQTGDCVPGPPYHVALLSYTFEPVPEPGTLGLFALGSGVMAAARGFRRRRHERGQA